MDYIDTCKWYRNSISKSIIINKRPDGYYDQLFITDYEYNPTRRIYEAYSKLEHKPTCISTQEEKVLMRRYIKKHNIELPPFEEPLTNYTGQLIWDM